MRIRVAALLALSVALPALAAPTNPKDLLRRMWEDLTPGELRQAAQARKLFDRLEAQKRPLESEAWKLLLRNSMSELVALERLDAKLDDVQSVRNSALALRLIGALDREGNAEFLARIALSPPLKPFDPPGMPGYYSGLLAQREGNLQTLREAARDALLDLDVPTPPAVLEALAVSPPDPRTARIALDLVRFRPDEEGLLAVLRAIDEGAFLAEGKETLPVRSDPGRLPLGILVAEKSSSALAPGIPSDAVTRLEYRKVVQEVTGLKPPGKGRALAWWTQNRAAALQAAESRQGENRAAKPWLRARKG